MLKHDETFAMFDRFGDIPLVGSGEQGLYHEDTRFLSQHELLIDGARPLYLGSTVQEYSSLLTIDLMNPDLGSDERRIAKGTLHIFRAKLLWQGACYEHVRLSNHGEAAVEATISLQYDADFVDLFEVRGMHRERRGERLADEVGPAEVLLPYRGLDDCTRRTRLIFEPTPTRCDSRQALYMLRLAPEEERHLYCTVVCETEDAPPLPISRLRRRARPHQRAAQDGAPAAVHDRDLEPAGQPVARALGLRPGDADHDPADRALPVCRRAVVLDHLRPRRHPHRARIPVGRPDAWRAACSPSWRRRRRPPRTPRATPSRARSCTRRGAARWR